VKIDGEYLFNGPREELWKILQDPEVLATALPGTKSLEKVGENEYTGGGHGPSEAHELYEQFGIALTMPEEADAIEQRARQNAAEQREALLATFLEMKDVIHLLGESPAAIERRIEEGTLLALLHHDVYRFPAWQFDQSSQSGVVSGLGAVLAVLPRSPYSKVLWLEHPHEELHGQRPIDALKAGKLGEVLAAAQLELA